MYINLLLLFKNECLSFGTSRNGHLLEIQASSASLDFRNILRIEKGILIPFTICHQKNPLKRTNFLKNIRFQYLSKKMSVEKLEQL